MTRPVVKPKNKAKQDRAMATLENRNGPKQNKHQSAAKTALKHKSGGSDKKSHKGDGLPGGKKVRKLVNSVVNPQIRALESQRGQLDRDYETANADVEYAHGETADYLNKLKANSDTEAANARAMSTAAADALRSRLGNNYSGVQNSAMSELERLGISQGGNFSGLQADAANANYVAEQSNTNALTTLDAQNSNANSVMSTIMGMNQGSRQAGLLANARARNDAIAKLQDAITETQMSRKDLAVQLMAQLGLNKKKKKKYHRR